MTLAIPRGNPARTCILLLLGYFAFHIVLRVSISGSLDFDEAEQVMLAQWLLPGYTEQPPLYTWLQYGLFQIFGRNVFAVSLLKNILLLFTYLFVFLAARITLRDDRHAVMATLSLLLIPQIGWESQRDMTHTTLVVCAAAATFWQGLGLLRKRNAMRYVLLGITIGVGILAKSNYFLFLTVFFLSIISFAEGREAFLSRKALVLPAIALAIASPYLLWLADNWPVLFTTAHKFKQGRELFYLIGPLSLIRAALLFVAPLLVLLFAVFPKVSRQAFTSPFTLERKAILRYFLVLFPVLLTIVLVFQVTYVKDRWLQPLLFAVPLFLFSLIPPAAVTARRHNFFLTAAAIVALCIYLAFGLRVVAAEKLGRFCRLNFPMAAMATDLSEAGFNEGLIISDDRFLAGNFSLAFPQAVTIIPGYQLGRFSSPSSKMAVVWLADKDPTLPPKLSQYVQSAFQINLHSEPIRYFEHPRLYGPHSPTRLAVILADIPQTDDL